MIIINHSTSLPDLVYSVPYINFLKKTKDKLVYIKSKVIMHKACGGNITII